MLGINKLSYWERKLFFNDLDFVIIGAGLVGYSTALELRKRYKDARILILERGYLPSGASTKNAGFACFGSPTELISDLSIMPEETVINLIHRRHEGLSLLLERCHSDIIDYQKNGSYELFLESESEQFQQTSTKLNYLNTLVESATGLKNVYSPYSNSFGFQRLSGIIQHREEGQINTGKMMQRLNQLIHDAAIHVLFSVDVNSWDESSNCVTIHTSIGEIESKQLLVCTNGFAQQLLPELEVQPARAQVLVTEPIPDLKWKGTFHYDSGYYYFRNIDNRILLGGGRNLNFEGESTTQMEQTAQIQQALEALLQTVIFPTRPLSIDYRWSGIMGVGPQKTPIVKRLSPRTAIGVRMGGMGVALGSLVGQELAELS